MKIFNFLIVLFFPILTLSLDLGKKIYTIQVYSSEKIEDSRKEAEKYKSFGEIFLWNKIINGKTYYRSCVGVFESLEEAKKIKKKIVKESNKNPIIIPLVK